MIDTRKMLFTLNHEWVRAKDAKTIVVGISDFAQSQLSEVTHVDVPEPDEQIFDAGEEIGVIESLRSSIPFHCPVSGQITASNGNLLSSPELVNEDPYGEGWIFEMKMQNPRELAELLSEDEYEGQIPDEDEE